jgi:hypothetical protein
VEGRVTNANRPGVVKEMIFVAASHFGERDQRTLALRNSILLRAGDDHQTASVGPVQLAPRLTECIRVDLPKVLCFDDTPGRLRSIVVLERDVLGRVMREVVEDDWVASACRVVGSGTTLVAR